MNSQSKKPISKQTNNLIEQLKGIGQDVGKSMGQDLISNIGEDVLSSLFGTPKTGDIKPNQSINLNQKQDIDTSQIENPYRQNAVKNEGKRVLPFENEFVNRLRQQEFMVTREIEQIRLELKELIKAINTFKKEMENAVRAEVIDPGVYHLTFLDRIKSMLIVMRKNLSESSTWLKVMSSRKKERRYWSMYKKKGTSFGLSSERSMATQTG